MESQFANLAEAAISKVIEEQEYEASAQTAYRRTSSYPVELWQRARDFFCCNLENLGPELYYSVTAPAPLKRHHRPRKVVKDLKPVVLSRTTDRVEIFPVVIPAEIWILCQTHWSKALNIKLAFASSLRGQVGIRVTKPGLDSPQTVLPMATGRTEPIDAWILEAILRLDADRVDPEFMRKNILHLRESTDAS